MFSLFFIILYLKSRKQIKCVCALGGSCFNIQLIKFNVFLALQKDDREFSFMLRYGMGEKHLVKNSNNIKKKKEEIKILFR